MTNIGVNIKRKMLRKKYKKDRETLAKDIIETGCNTIILNIELQAISKIKDHFIYEIAYLDEGEVKSLPVIAKNILGILETIEPYVNTGKSAQQISFEIGANEDVLISRSISKSRKEDDEELES
jgi:hypothetical protein